MMGRSLAWMLDNQLPKQLLYAKLTYDTRGREKLCKWFKGDMKQVFQIMEVCLKSWNTVAQLGPE